MYYGKVILHNNYECSIVEILQKKGHECCEQNVESQNVLGQMQGMNL